MISLSSYAKSLKGPLLVTGAAGFIGANLLKRLRVYRDDVYGIVHSKQNWRLIDVPEERIVSVDITNKNAVKIILGSIKPKTVFDCAAYGAYPFENDAEIIYSTNFLSVVNLVEELSELDICAYVHAGSSSEYGWNCKAPKEKDLRCPNSHYAVSKSAAADFIGYKGRQDKFPGVNLRLYSVYGPLEDTSRLIPNLLRHALSGRFPNFVDPQISRDFIYIDDACDAFIMAAASISPNFYGNSFNIGCGFKTTIADLAEIAASLFNIREQPQFGTMEARAWDLREWYADPTLAENAFGWKATTRLEVGLKRTAEWIASLSDSDMQASTKQNPKEINRSISAVIACYKDELAIPHMYRRLTDTFKKIGVDYEIIFVNDGSPDESAKIIRQISAHDSRVIGVSHSRNFGSQMAFRSGMELSSKESVVLLDGDLQDPPELIEQFYHQWRKGFDVVYGRRVKREMPMLWNLAYKAFYRIFAAFSYVAMPYDAGDFSLIDKKVVAWILNCPERDLFIRGLRAYVGFNQAGVDYVRPKRKFGVSTNDLFKNIAWAKRGIFSFSDTPLTILTTSGLILLGVSFLLMIVLASLRLLIPDIAPRGITTVLISILLFGSLNLFAIGLVGEYVAKIMTEVKKRPRLIRATLIQGGKYIQIPPAKANF